VIFAHRLGSWDLSDRARVVGVLNVTPDSFSDGGRYLDPERALTRAEQLAAEGADAIDVGGQSTRPGAGAAVLGPDEEWARVAPVLAALAKRSLPPVSIDTFHGEVARRALEHGAAIVNDVTGLIADPSVAAHVASAGAGLVIMHSLGGPGRFHEPREYQDVSADVAAFLRAQMRTAAERGVPPERIALDPGVGFSKRAEQSVETLRGIPRLLALGRPLYVGISRKSFLGALTDQPVEARLAAGLGTTIAAYALGARIFRAHDVRETRDALRMAEAVLGAKIPQETRA
jgi:dihydropteroate synthase